MGLTSRPAVVVRVAIPAAPAEVDPNQASLLTGTAAAFVGVRGGVRHIHK